MVESWEDPSEQDDEDEQLEPWQEAARRGRRRARQ